MGPRCRKPVQRAQEGRQNNNCTNPNNLTLTTTNNRAQATCVAVDRSTNIATINR
ncbi:hypothetical protein [Streptomyces sp. NPDC051776]|uniref:hypothetical protein n=1 Tax=Streptomyces sp. NPDC051776 TaxID=3155414 RepID=UPI0034366557